MRSIRIGPLKGNVMVASVVFLDSLGVLKSAKRPTFNPTAQDVVHFKWLAAAAEEEEKVPSS
jgi:hypothetical protein